MHAILECAGQIGLVRVMLAILFQVEPMLSKLAIYQCLNILRQTQSRHPSRWDPCSEVSDMLPRVHTTDQEQST